MVDFTLRVGIAPVSSGDFGEIQALLDPTTTYMWVPRSVLERMGITPEESMLFISVDGRRAE